MNPKLIIEKSKNWSDFVNNLEKLGSNASHNKLKGDCFELVTKLWLLTNPLYINKLKNVWIHSEIPQSIIDKLQLAQPEVGIDIIAELDNGKYLAIQCKYHTDPDINVGYSEASTFFSMTEKSSTYSFISERILCTSAYKISKKILDIHNEKLLVNAFEEFSKLDEVKFEQFRKILANEKVTFEPRMPRTHQIKAIDSFEKFFSSPKNKRGKIIHACGAGKSLTGYWCFDKANVNSVLIAVPSLALVKQILEDWVKESIAHEKDFDWIAICSNDEVAKSDDNIMSTNELGIITTTNTDEIKSFLSKKNSEYKIVVTTYQSAEKLCEAAKSIDYKFELGLFDEAHKTVGNKNKTFAKLLYDENIKINFRLFMTATERYYKGDSNEVLSMDDKNIYGEIIDSLTFRQAIESKPPILSDYKVVMPIVRNSEFIGLLNDNQMLDTTINDKTKILESSFFTSLIAFKKIVNKNLITKTISFHRSIKRAKEFRELIKFYNQSDENIHEVIPFHISGKDGPGERSKIIKQFLNEKYSIITNARCLTEGVDIPQIDAILFADPKKSIVDIVQASGRAFRRYEGKKFGYIIIPLVLDENDNPTDDSFNLISEIVCSLGTVDERIVDSIKSVITGNKGKYDEELEDPIDYGFFDSTSIDLKKLYKDISIKLWNRLSYSVSSISDSKFNEWLSESNLSDVTRYKYLGAIRKISNDLIKQNIYHGSLDELMSEDPEKIINEYFEIPENKEMDDRGHHMYSAAAKKLIEFYKSNNISS